MEHSYTLLWEPPLEHCDGLAALVNEAAGTELPNDYVARVGLSIVNEHREAQLQEQGRKVRYVRASPGLVCFLIQKQMLEVTNDSVTDALTMVYDAYGEQPIFLQA